MQIRNQRIVQLQKELEALVLALQRCLRSLRCLEIERVIDGQCHLPRHQCKKSYFVWAEGIRAPAGHAHAPDPAVHSRERKRADRFEALLQQQGRHGRKAGFLPQRRNYQRHLPLIDPLGNRLIGRAGWLQHWPFLVAELAGMPHHFVGGFVVLRHHHAVELDHLTQLGCHGAEKILRIAVRRNRLRHADQRLITVGQQVVG